jgi:hypothetical protein
MKNYFVLFLPLIFMIGCTQQKEQTIAEYALDLDSAVQYIHRYDSIAKEVLKDSVPIKSFTIRAADLLESLGLPAKTKVKYTHARIYLGMDENNKFRIFLTPVEGASITSGVAGSDVIFKPGLRDISDARTTNGSYVLDFSAPCPNTCPNGSPLNQ